MNWLRTLGIGSAALLVAAVGLIATAWELRRRYPETEVAV